MINKMDPLNIDFLTKLVETNRKLIEVINRHTRWVFIFSLVLIAISANIVVLTDDVITVARISLRVELCYLILSISILLFIYYLILISTITESANLSYRIKTLYGQSLKSKELLQQNDFTYLDYPRNILSGLISKAWYSNRLAEFISGLGIIISVLLIVALPLAALIFSYIKIYSLKGWQIGFFLTYLSIIFITLLIGYSFFKILSLGTDIFEETPNVHTEKQ